MKATRSILGTGFRFPVRVNPSGGLSWSSDEEDIQEAIWIILGTSRGERVMRAKFGCGIHEEVFAPINATTVGVLGSQIREALTTYEPRIDVVDVRVAQPADQTNHLLIRVDYRIRANNAMHNLVYPFSVREGIGA